MTHQIFVSDAHGLATHYFKRKPREEETISCEKIFRQIFVALAFVAATSAVPADLDRGGRIVGGTSTTIASRPFQVSLRTTSNFHFCGGSIITNRWVISAAHCLLGQSTTAIKAVVGTDRLNAGGTAYNITQIVNHPSYTDVSKGFDVGLIKTTTNITFSANVATINLPTAAIGSGISAVVSGWGQLSNPGSASIQLQALVVTTLANANCKQYVSGLPANTICTQTPVGKGVCMGDSGGPLTAYGTQVIGIVSYGTPCALGYPDVYTSVYDHRVWIQSQIV